MSSTTPGAEAPLRVLDVAAGDLSVEQFHRILELRVRVFVVEQECVYQEVDGRDLEPATRHLWAETPNGEVEVYLRLLDDGDARRIGRVVTRPESRHRGLAGELVRAAIAASVGPWVLDAQSYLQQWYEAVGFAPTGVEFIEDGIPHVPMRRVVDEPSA